ncbi:hypothetical protein DSO57_1002850 [Entomophthora muscae]|uniref:Uncharacterized protein n=1 Tax=Entomophthora muscae TaxID=34485 RepID=A0ACC2RZV6_9FUNG|nr:hypothetical protein DSO57_1002850 [Entomophthora muscae]
MRCVITDIKATWSALSADRNPKINVTFKGLYFHTISRGKEIPYSTWTPNLTVRDSRPGILNPGFKLATPPEKRKRGCLRKPAGGIEPRSNHQGEWKPNLKRKIGLNLITTTIKSNNTTRASLLTGPGGLAAPNSSRATSSNATNELGGSQHEINDFCWVIQQIQYQLGLLNNLSNKSVQVPILPTSPTPVLSPSHDSHATLQPIPKFNATSPTDVMKNHLQEDVPASPSNQINPVEEDSQAIENPTMPAVSNCFIGSRTEKKPLSQEYSPEDDNPPTQKQVQTAKQPQPQMIELGIISHQSASSNPTNLKMSQTQTPELPPAMI